MAQAALPCYPPRGLSREEAARYLGVGATLFDKMVEDGRMPQPKVINARRIWDRLGLDLAFESLPDRPEAAPDANPFDGVMA